MTSKLAAATAKQILALYYQNRKIHNFIILSHLILIANVPIIDEKVKFYFGGPNKRLKQNIPNIRWAKVYISDPVNELKCTLQASFSHKPCTLQMLQDLSLHSCQNLQTAIDAFISLGPGSDPLVSQKVLTTFLKDLEVPCLFVQANYPYFRYTDPGKTPKVILFDRASKFYDKKLIKFGKMSDGEVADWNSENDFVGHVSFITDFTSIKLDDGSKRYLNSIFDPGMQSCCTDTTPLPYPISNSKGEYKHKVELPKPVSKVCTQPGLLTPKIFLRGILPQRADLMLPTEMKVCEDIQTQRVTCNFLNLKKTSKVLDLETTTKVSGNRQFFQVKREASLETLTTVKKYKIDSGTLLLKTSSNNNTSSGLGFESWTPKILRWTCFQYLGKHTVFGSKRFLVNNGVYENYNGSLVSTSESSSKYYDTFRMFGLTTEFRVPNFILETSQSMGWRINDRLTFGKQKRWRSQYDKGCNVIIYKNCGPLNAFSCWNVWKEFSGCNESKPVFIKWTHENNFSESTADKFDFPQITSSHAGYYYSWEKIKLSYGEAEDMEMYYNDINLLDFPVNFTHIQDEYFWRPVKQKIEYKVTKQQNEIVGIQVHRHQKTLATQKMDRYFCTDACVSGDEGILDRPGAPLSQTHGLLEIEFKNLTSTLFNIPSITRPDRVTKLLNAAPSCSMTPKLQHDYSLMILRYVNALERSPLDAHTLVSQAGPQKIIPRISSTPAQDLYYDKVPTFGGIRSVPVYGGYRKSKGEALNIKIKSEKTCVSCKKYPPLKYKWVRGYCPSCRREMEDSEIQREATNNTYWSKPGLHEFRNPVLLDPVKPHYKPKPLRDGITTGQEYFTTKGIGWCKSTIPHIPKNSQPSQLIGVGISTLARCFNFNVDVEEETLKTRAFAKPESDGDQHYYDRLFDYLVSKDLIGERDCFKKSGTTPFCVPEFYPGGYIHMELINLRIKHTLADLGKIERNLFYLNENVWMIPKDKWRSVDSPQQTWIGTMDPGKRSKYWQSLINFNPHTKPTKIKFQCFLKRELSNCGSDDRGIRCQANPRIIFDPEAWSQVVAGPVLRSATNLLHQIMNKDSKITYFGGLQPNEANEWIRTYVNETDMSFRHKGIELPEQVVIENDFSKMDSCYGDACFRFIYRVYTHWGLPMESPLFKQVLKLWSRPKARFRSGTKVRAPSMNASGRSDTALMNAIINGYVQLASYLVASLNKPLNTITDEEHERFMSTFGIGLLGDDSLTFADKFDDMQRLVADEVSHYGFETRDMKVWQNVAFATFLGQRLYPVLENGKQTIAWGPTIGRKLYKMGTALDVQPAPLQWLKSNMKAILITSPHVPIISDIASTLNSMLVGLAEDEFTTTQYVKDMYKYKRGFEVNTTLQADWSRMPKHLEKVYSLNISDYFSLLEILTTLKHPTFILNYPWLHSMVRQDTVG